LLCISKSLRPYSFMAEEFAVDISNRDAIFSLSCSPSGEHLVGGLERASKCQSGNTPTATNILTPHYITFLPTESFNSAHGAF
jgi:hypothetical protein